MILVDSSVWIHFFNGKTPPAVRQLQALLHDTGAPLAVADLVLFEVLRGFRQERDYLAARQTLLKLPSVQIGGEAQALIAAGHYRNLRAMGRTIHSPVDVLLASYCIENGHALLHSDSDFDVFEELSGLRSWRH